MLGISCAYENADNNINSIYFMSIKKLIYEEILNERAKKDEALKLKRNPFGVILDNIRSIYNVGSIFRTSDAVLADHIYLCGFTPNPEKDDISKTALGSEETVPWKTFDNTCDAIKFAKNRGFKVYALEQTDRKKDFSEITKDEFPISFVLGNELSGVSPEALSLCDDAVEIPMLGHKHSLNVSVSAGVIYYKALELCL